MESESGSKLERAHELRQVRIARRWRQRMRMSKEEVQAWSQAWLEAWTGAKTAAIAVEVNARLFAQPWTEVWTRAEAQAWAEAKVQVEARCKPRLAEAKAVEVEAWTEAWAAEVKAAEAKVVEARTRGEEKAAGQQARWVEAKTMEARSAWARTWSAKAKAAEVRAQMWASARAVAVAEAEALALAGAWAWARGGLWTRGESVPFALEDSSTIWRILSDLNQYGIARDLWHRSHDARDEYWCLLQFISPITRLPLELLQQIFLIIIDDASSPPLVLMLVSKHWHAIVTRIWALLNLGTRTPMDAVTSKLERNQWLLDVVVDTDSDRGDFIPSDDAFEAIFAAIEASSRWRSLVVESFPAQADLTEDVVNRGLQRCHNATMSRFTTFKVKSACETSPLLNSLLRILGTMASSELTTVEINSANVISFLAPAYPSIFHSVKVLSLDTPGIPNPVDLLPHLHQLESFTASHISFPIYHNDINLPFIHTLRYLRLRAVSIQWMSGRTFHILECCTLIFPLHQHVLRTFSATLPNCKHLTFQGHPLEILGGIVAHKLTHISVTSSGSFNRRGSQQLVRLSSQILGERRLHPRVLHISIEASNRAWMNALGLMSDLEELVIHNARPSSLGTKVLQSLVVQPFYGINLGATSIPVELGAPFCPSLWRFGLKYDRWLRSSEQFHFTPIFKSIIRSRQHSNRVLRSFSLWIRGVQVELIAGSGLSIKGFDLLRETIEQSFRI